MEDRELKKIKEISLELLVVKDNFLIETKYSLSVIEQKIVLMLISQLDSIGAKELDYYEFDINEMLKYLSLGEKNYTFLQKMIKDLYERKVELKSDDKRRTFMSRWISSFEYNGKEGYVRFGLDSQLKPFLLNISQNFTRYPLERVLSLNNKHSIRLYEMFKKVEKIKKIKISIPEIKQKLQLQEKYKEFRDFKRAFLEPIIKEINEETELNISYEFIKTSRKVTGIFFKIEKKEMEVINSESNENLLSDQMLSLGLSYNKIQDFIKKYDDDRLQRNIEHVQNELEKNPNIKNIGGLLNVAIRDDFAYLPPEILKKKRAKEDKKQIEEERKKRAKILEDYIEKIKEEIHKDKTKKYDKYTKILTDEDIEKERDILWESDYFKLDNEIVYNMGKDTKGGEMLLNIAYKEQVISYEKKDIRRVMKKTCNEKEFYDDIFKELSKEE